MKRILLTSIFLIGIIAATVKAEIDTLSTDLQLGTVDNFPPFTYMSDGKLVGVDIDLVNEMSERVGIDIQITAYPWARVMAFVKEGVLDGGFAAFKNEERKSFCLYTGVLHFEEFYLFVKAGNEFTYTGIPDLYGRIIGKDIGVHVNYEFAEAVKAGQIKVHEVRDENMLNIKMLDAGRVDAAIGDLGVMQYYARALSLEKTIVPLQPISKPTPAYLVLSKNSKLKDKIAMQLKLKEALEQIRNDGTYDLFFTKHVNQMQ